MRYFAYYQSFIARLHNGPCEYHSISESAFKEIRRWHHDDRFHGNRNAVMVDDNGIVVEVINNCPHKPGDVFDGLSD